MLGSDLRVRLRSLFRRQSVEVELDEELRFHVERQVELYVARGVPPEEARRRARLEFGGTEQVKEVCREARGISGLETLMQDLRYGGRVLRRNPGFTAVAILSLALGVGANTVVFSVANAVMLQPMPIEHPEQVYSVSSHQYPTLSFPYYRDLRDRATLAAGMAAYRMAPMALDTGTTTSAGAQRVWGYLATGSYFDLLGVRPALGRFFHSADDRKVSAEPWAVLSYNTWQARFGGDPGVLGRVIRINTRPFTVIGVAPDGFRGTELFYQPEIWVPMMMQPEIEGSSWLEKRGDANAFVLARLKQNVTRAAALEELRSIAAAMEREHPEENHGWTVKLSRPGLVADMGRGPVEAFVLGILGLAGLVLLAACANLGTLLGARASDRGREIAIRLSIGAGKFRIVRQLLTESLLLSLAGGAAGCGLALVLMRLITEMRLNSDFPIQMEIAPDWRVFLFALLVSTATGLLFGLVPARSVWKADANQALRGALPGEGSRRGLPLREVLLVVQVALCCVLVTASFVSLRGMATMLSARMGIDPDRVAVVGIDLTQARYSKEDGRQFLRRALDRIAQVPGVTLAAWGNSVPLSMDQSNTNVFRDGSTDFRNSNSIHTSYFDVSPGYFATIGTRLLAGRDFNWHDDANGPRVAIVNQTLARKLTGTANAVGRRFLQSRDQPVEIIGVVEDGKYETLTEKPRAAVFRPAWRSYTPGAMFVARCSSPESIAPLLRREIAQLDPQLAVFGNGSLRQLTSTVFFPGRAATFALGSFGVLAMMLALTGIYGLASYTVSRRIREIGIRIAVGARPVEVLGFALRRTSLLVSMGCLGGLGAGVAVGRVLESVVYGANARDPWVLAGVTTTMLAIALLAGAAPARRALAVDPVDALRHD